MGNNTKMKKSLNKSKRKVIPMCYQKLNLSRSNTSLPQLITLGVYKKRINDLVKNNRLLAVALQEARLENTYQNNLLKDFARCSNQMKTFKFKVNEMVKTTITKLVSDVNELVKSLDDDWSVDGYNLLQNKGPHDRMKIRGPTVECVEEEGSVLSSDNDECETVPDEIQSEETHDVGGVQEMEPAILESEANTDNIPDMPPILYIDDSEEQDSKKKSSRKSKSRSSSRKRIANNQLSLTPELDIDIDFMNQIQNSSRRQTQVFTPARSLGRSRKASSVGPTFIEHETPKNSMNRRDSIPQRKLSPVLTECDQSSKNVDDLEVTNVNTKTRGSKNENISDLQLSSVNTDDNSASINNLPHNAMVVSPVKVTVSNVASSHSTLANHTILMDEDMELTDVVRPVVEPADIVTTPCNSSDSIGNKAKKLFLEPENECNNSKLLAYLEDTEVIQLDKYLNIVEKGNQASISSGMPPCNTDEQSGNVVPIDKSPSESPSQRRSSRKRKKIITLTFSSSDSESDFTPVSPGKKKRIQRDTVIYKPPKKSSGGLASTENAKKNSLASEGVHKISPSALSVYDLDVSNSKKPVKKSRPRNKAKSSLTKEIAKPLSQKCSITKLKGAECKFSKNENFVINNKENQQPEISKQQETIEKISQNNAPKENPFIFTFNLNEIVSEENQQSEIIKQQETIPEVLQKNVAKENPYVEKNKIVAKENCIKTSRDELSSPKVADSKEICFKSPGARRVSFASTDVVCNFTRMSIPKTIIQNKKVHRISKSNFNTFDFNFGDLETNETKGYSSNINLPPDFESENTNLAEKPHNHVIGNNPEDLESKLLKEKKIMPTKSTSHVLDKAVTNFEPLALGENLDALKVSLPRKAPDISSTSTDQNVDSISLTAVTVLQKDPKHLVSQKTAGSKCQKVSKISNKKLEKCVLVKTNDHQVLKSLEENRLLQDKVFSDNSNERSGKENSESTKKIVNSRKSIPVRSSAIIVKDADSKSPPIKLPVLKKAQKHNSENINEHPDSKSAKKNLSSQKDLQSCGGGDMVGSEKNTTKFSKVKEPGTCNVKDLIPEDLNPKSLKETEEEEETHSSSSKVEVIVTSEPPKKNKQSRKKALHQISGKTHEDISALSKCSNPSFQSAKNSPHKALTQNDFKENTLNNVLDRAQADPRVKTKKSQQKSVPPTDNLHIKVPQDENIKDHAHTVHKRAISSLEPCHPSSCKKSSNLRLSLESSPVLKDVMNLEENTNKRESSRRTKAAVSYKEQKLNVKMRRE